MRVLLFLFLLSFFYALEVFAQTNLKEKHEYVIENLDNYSRTISLEGFNLSTEEATLSIPFTDLTTLDKIEFFIQKKDKWKKSKIGDAYDETNFSWSSFYTGVKYRFYKIPPMTSYKMVLKTSHKHSIFLSSFYKKGYFKSSEVTYNMHVADALKLVTNNDETYSGDFLIKGDEIDSLKKLSFLICNKSDEPLKYLSSWFHEKSDPSINIGLDDLPEELDHLRIEQNKDTIVRYCFEFVKKQIKYIDIEDGINALIPRKATVTLEKKLGDCKDMATLLTSLLQSFNVESYLGISRTNSKKDTLNFPSISLANHMICVVKNDGDWMFLDPTEDECFYRDPSLQILGTEVLVLNESGMFLNVPNNPFQESNGSVSFTFTSEKVQMKIRTKGKMNLFFSSLINRNNRSDLIDKIINRNINSRWTLLKDSISMQESFIELESSLGFRNVTELQGKKLFNLNSLPDMSFFLALTQYDDKPLYNAKWDIQLNFEGNIQPLNSEWNELDLKGNSIMIKSSFRKATESFEESDLFVEWNNLINQPITISHD